MKAPIYGMDYTPIGAEDQKRAFIGCCIRAFDQHDLLQKFHAEYHYDPREKLFPRTVCGRAEIMDHWKEFGGKPDIQPVLAQWCDFVALHVWGTEHEPRPSLS